MEIKLIDHALLTKGVNIDLMIKEKLHVLTEDRNKTIRKVFEMSIEEIQDNPRKSYQIIKDYVKQHEDKIEDFWFDSYVDENTFTPMLVLHVLPIASIRENLINSYWNNIVNLNVIPFVVEDKISEIFQRFIFEFNDFSTRKHLSSMIEQLIKFYTNVEFFIEDATSKDQSDSGQISLLTVSEYGTMPLNEFLFLLSEKNMFHNK
jgi:hypothetical protein